MTGTGHQRRAGMLTCVCVCVRGVASLMLQGRKGTSIDAGGVERIDQEERERFCSDGCASESECTCTPCGGCRKRVLPVLRVRKEDRGPLSDGAVACCFVATRKEQMCKGLRGESRSRDRLTWSVRQRGVGFQGVAGG